MNVSKNEVENEIEVDEQYPDGRRDKFCFFALFTHSDLTPTEIIIIKKSRNMVEKGFLELNTDFIVCPIHHSKDRQG